MPTTHATAAVLSCGDELILGQTLDTNSRWLSGRLSALGISPLEHVTVPDDRSAIAAAFLRLSSLADVVISTGGLGPTADDLTREALAGALGAPGAPEPLVEDAGALAQILGWFSKRSRAMPGLNRAQALRPRSAVCLPNLSGTAPGLLVVRSRPAGPQPVTAIFCLPGPPVEMRPMFEAEVVPRLHPPTGRIVLTRALHCFGLGESEIAQRLGDLMDRSRHTLVGTTASKGVVSCRIRFEGVPGGLPVPGVPHPSVFVAEAEKKIREAVGPYLFGADADTLPSALLELLRQRSQTLAVVESCTGGMLGSQITEVPGSSAAFLGGWLTYSNEQKRAMVGVPAATFAAGGPGAVSRPCALAMAVGGLERSGADHCLSITGIAGPDGGTPDKPVGTVWIARASRAGDPDVRRFQFTGDRANIRDWSAKSALAMLRLHLIGHESLPLLRQA